MKTCVMILTTLLILMGCTADNIKKPIAPEENPEAIEIFVEKPEEVKDEM